MTSFQNIKSNQIRELLQDLLDHTPAIYHSQGAFMECIEFFRKEDWESTIDSFIELTEATKHYFSDEFWNKLRQASKQMGLKNQVEYCKQQLLRNSEAKQVIPFGWTSERTGAHTYNMHISDILQEKWTTERREKDKAASLLHEGGIHFKPQGKTGIIYYVEDGKLAEVRWEEGEIFWTGFSGDWALPAQTKMSAEEYIRMRSALKQWTEAKGINFF